ncbi:MAG: DUF3187 family protein [Nitrososphaerales archaeon]
MLSIVFATVIGLQIAADVDDIRGPLRSRGYTIFQIASENFIPDDPVSIQPNHIELSTTISVSNTFNYTDNYILDSELLRIGISCWYAIDEVFTVGVQIPIYYISGGFLDQLIIDFHELIGIINERNAVNNNELYASIYGIRHNIDTEFMLGNIMSTVRINLPQINGLSVGLKTQLPTSADTDWARQNVSGVGIDFIYYKNISNIYFQIGAGVSYIDEGHIFDYELDNFRINVLGSIDIKLSDWLSIICTIYGASGPIKSFGAYSNWELMTNVGFRLKVAPHYVFEFGCIENMVTLENTLDFGIHTGFVVRY